MGYETKLFIGIKCLPRQEIKKDYTKRYEDGSGPVSLKDDNGEYIRTGRTEHYFMAYAMIDLCKCGDGALSKLRDKYYYIQKANSDKEVIYTYNGNDHIIEDLYGDILVNIPLKEVLRALKKDNKTEKYRRFTWAIKLLESMTNDEENISVLTMGH